MRLTKGRKGDLEIRYLILFILAIIVLFVVALVFYKQIAMFLGKLKVLWDQLGGIESGIETLKD